MHSSFPAETPKLQLAAEQPFDRRMLEPNPTQSKKDTPQPRAKEKYQKDGWRGEIKYTIKLQPTTDARKAQTKPCAHHETSQRLSQTCH